MRLSEAVDLIRPAVSGPGGTWADFGAGTGLFTRALADLLDPSGRVLAVDRDPSALVELRRTLVHRSPALAEVTTAVGDFRDLTAIDALAGIRLDGALFANALHFAPDAGQVLGNVARLLGSGGRVAVVEYQGRPPSPWVPYPISVERLARLAEEAGLGPPVVVGDRPSAYGGRLYCALLERSSG